MTANVGVSLSPEARALFRIARGPVTDAAKRELLEQPLDWERLSKLAQREKAVTVVADHLDPALGVPIPDGAHALRRVAMLTTFHMMHLEKRLKESVAVLAAEGISVVLLKGAGLAYTAYPSFDARPMADLDLLVRAPDAQRAQALMAGSGWESPDAPARIAFYGAHHHLPPMHDRKVPSAALELHTELFIAGHPLGLTAAAVWADARPMRVGATPAFVPHPHHQLLHSCLHFAWGHAMQAGAWRTFRDVAAVVRTGGVSWEQFVALAESSRGESCCYWTFELGRVLAGADDVPTWVLDRLRPPHSRVVHDRIRRHLALTLLPTESLSPSVRLDRFVWEAAIRPEHYGHGAARPWAQEDRIAERGDPLPAAAPSGLGGSLHKVGACGRYLRTMFAR